MDDRPAGYSGTPLPKKLGMKPGQRIAFFHAPPEFARALGALPDGVEPTHGADDDAPLDVAVFFTRRAAELAGRFPALARRLAPAGALWIAWPKRGSGVETDLSENVIRGIGLVVGLVDVKVCAIDETWSGLKFVVRVKDRKRR